jgi:hypothetical protein
MLFLIKPIHLLPSSFKSIPATSAGVLLGKSERRILEAYLKGERLSNYTVLLHRIRKVGLKAIIEGCERDLALLRDLAKSQLERD